MILQENYILSNGLAIPKIGLGTWFIGNDEAPEAVQKAIEIGYRHIDTAQAYQNEAGIGLGIQQAGIPRNEIFVTTKLAAEIKNYEDATQAINDSLEALQLSYIDLMIIHSPKPWMEYYNEDRYYKGNKEAWRALEDAYKAGKIKAIGVSNFLQEDLENLFESCTVKPMVNQVLAHISNTPFELIEYCKQHNILVEAYSPIGHGELFKNELVQQLADKYQVTVAQLAIRYCLQLGLLPLPKTANQNHMKNNAAVDFEISESDLATLKTIEKIKDYGEASMFPVFSGK